MRLPFTIEQFYGVFRQYNEAVWPAQIVFGALWLALGAWLPGDGGGRERKLT